MNKIIKSLTENRKHPKISREEYKTMLDSGHKFTDAGLYEPQNAPKDTKFVHVQLGKNLSVFKRVHPPKQNK